MFNPPPLHGISNSPPRQGDLGAFGTKQLGHGHGPSLQARPCRHTRQDHMRGLVEGNTHCGISRPADRPRSIRFAGMILARGEAKAGADLLRGPKALGLIDGGTEGQRNDDADARRTHQTVTDGVGLGRVTHALVDQDELLAQGLTSREQRLQDLQQARMTSQQPRT